MCVIYTILYSNLMYSILDEPCAWTLTCSVFVLAFNDCNSGEIDLDLQPYSFPCGGLLHRCPKSFNPKLVHIVVCARTWRS